MKKTVIIGGGTFNPISVHFALSAPAFGNTARDIYSICEHRPEALDSELVLTQMADNRSGIRTNEDLADYVDYIVKQESTKIIFFTAAICDFEVISLKAANSFRLSSSQSINLTLEPAPKILNKIRFGDNGRKDIFLVAFKTTTGATPEEQYSAGLKLLKENSCNLVLANDSETRLNMIICPEEAVYCQTTDRLKALEELVEMAYLRSHLTFTRSTVIAGEAIPWESNLVFPVLREIVDYCIDKGAYKKFLGVTAGHFAAKLSDTEFLTSRRKTDFNDMKTVGLVKVKTDGPDNVLAYGFKPSVGGQSQRIVFEDHPNYNCIVHFHCPLKEGSKVPVASQREFECGSHSCGINTSNNLAQFGNLKAVYLDQHGPNIVFNSNIDPQEVIDFIEQNFDLEKKTGGYIPIS